jgi:DHA1 family bicyclomycin/chloramphenicol resistance-like MFS transporter
MPIGIADRRDERRKSSVRFLDRASPPHVITLVLLAGVSAMSMNVFLPSLPRMAAHFGTDYALMQLSVAIYLGMNALLQVFVGPIADLYGRRPVIIGGLVLFLLATLGCIYAPNVEIFLAFRMAQAAVVTGMVLSRAIVRDMFPPDQAASMIGYVTMGMSVVPMLAPALGGWLDELFGWQANFWALLAIGVILFLLVWFDLGETGQRGSISLLAQFRQYPELLTSRRFWGYCLASAFSSGAFFAYLGGAPYVGDRVFGLDPAVLGAFFGAPAVGYFLGNYLSGRYSVRFGINRMILAGTLLCSGGMLASLALFELGLGNPYVFFGFMTFVGLGNGLTIPNATSGMLSVRPHLAGTASGLGGAMMIGGGAALSALAGAVLGDGRGAEPLIVIMLATALAGVAAILFTIRRERQLSGD